MGAERWQGRYRDVLELAAGQAARGPIACGFTNNIDHVAQLDLTVLRRLLDGRRLQVDGPRITEPADIDELVIAIAQCAAAGEGYDLPVPADVQEWLIARAPGERRLGGTGAQAACSLAALGYSVLAHLTTCSAEQVAAFVSPGRILVPGAGSLRPVSEATRPGDETMVHVALEYDAGLLVEGVAAPAGNRVIVSHDPVNSAFRIDPAFVDAVADPANGVRRVLLSGYSQITTTAALEGLLADTIAALARWPGHVIHLELGAMPRQSDLRLLVTTLGPLVGSVGMNLDEYRDLACCFDLPWPDSRLDLPDVVRTLRARIGANRIVVHTAEVVLASADGDLEAVRDSLLFGALVASSRARIGRFPTMVDLEETLARCQVNPRGLARAIESGPEFVAVPTIDVSRPAAAVGLGDSFAAGLLAMS